MERVEVSRCMLGSCGMQVCAESGATDEEILKVCNVENPAGTERGWVAVDRSDNPGFGPAQCEDDPNRTHFRVDC